jgi:hypothetical protein
MPPIFPGLFVGKHRPDRLVVHAVDGHDLGGRPVAAHYGDARRVDAERSASRATTASLARPFSGGAFTFTLSE